MKSAKIIATIGFVCCVLFVGAQQSGTSLAFVGPMVWSTPIEAFASSGGEPPFLRAMFTPETEILVTRIDAFDENGPRLNLNSVSGQPVPCSPQPSVRIAGASNGYTLQLTNTFLPNSASTYTDSGPLSLKFEAGTPISVTVAPPPAKQAAQCITKQLNLQVHYQARVHQ